MTVLTTAAPDPGSASESGPDAPRLDDRTGSDPLEAAAVRAGWLLVDAHERLGIEESRRVFGHELAAWYDYARATVPNLVTWPAVEAHLTAYENDNNRLRFRRVLDFVRPGDHVFDVGFGRGYLLGVLLRDGEVASYHGIDILDYNRTATKEMLEVNGFRDTNIGLEIGDLYELTADHVAATDTDLVVCCEVLEHVPDAERALQVLADGLPPHGDLLFSVPLNGRLESVWGHLTVFDVARLKAMARAAGLYVHHVEPLANTWTLVVASRDPEPSARVREARRRPDTDVSVPLTEARTFVDVEAAAIEAGHWVTRTSCTIEATDDEHVLCTVTGDDPETAGDAGQYGGVAFAVDGLTAMRLGLEMLDFANVRRVYVDAHRGTRRVGRWIWRPTSAQLEARPERRFSLRPRESGPHFKADEFGRFAQVDRVEVFVQIAPGTSAAFTVRAAYLP